MVGKSNFEFSYLLLLFTKLFYQTQILGPQKDTFPMWLPAVEGVPLPLPLLASVKEFHVTNDNNNNSIVISYLTTTCGAVAAGHGLPPMKVIKIIFRRSRLTTLGKLGVFFTLDDRHSSVSCVSFLSRIAYGFLIYTCTVSQADILGSQRGLRSVAITRSPRGWLR